MSTPETAVLPPTPEAGLSEPARLLNTFIAPSKTFADIRRNASWWVPWLLVSVISFLFLVSVDQKIGWERVIYNEIAKNPQAAARMEKLSPEQRDQAMQMQLTIGKVTRYATPVLTLILFVIMAAVMMLVFNFGVGADVKFGTAMAIVCYSWLPTILRAILGAVTVFAGADPEGFNIRNPVMTNPAYLMDPTQHKFLYGVASSFDVVGIWVAILVGLGFAMNSKVKKGTAIIITLALYFLWNFGAAAVTSMF